MLKPAAAEEPRSRGRTGTWSPAFLVAFSTQILITWWWKLINSTFSTTRSLLLGNKLGSLINKEHSNSRRQGTCWFLIEKERRGARDSPSIDRPNWGVQRTPASIQLNDRINEHFFTTIMSFVIPPNWFFLVTNQLGKLVGVDLKGFRVFNLDWNSYL